MNTEDQEKIYKLYEGNFRNIQYTQPDVNLGIEQHPNTLRSTPEFLGLAGRAKHDRLTPEQEEGESKFKYRDDQGNVFSLIKVVDEVAYLKDRRVGAVITIPVSKLSRVLKEI